MALDTLKDIKEIGGFNVGRYPHEDLSDDYIVISEEDNAIGFKLQNGPIKEVGVNGCQVDQLIQTAEIIIHELNKKFPCVENGEVISHLSQALYWLNIRKTMREKRGVEGQSLP